MWSRAKASASRSWEHALKLSAKKPKAARASPPLGAFIGGLVLQEGLGEGLRAVVGRHLSQLGKTF